HDRAGRGFSRADVGSGARRRLSVRYSYRPSKVRTAREYIAMPKQMEVHRRMRWNAVLVATALAASIACSSHAPAREARSAARDVVLHLTAYEPDALNVPAGTTVTWTQKDAGFHTVTSGTADVAASGEVTIHPSGVFDSGKLATGKQFS